MDRRLIKDGEKCNGYKETILNRNNDYKPKIKTTDNNFMKRKREMKIKNRHA